MYTYAMDSFISKDCKADNRTVYCFKVIMTQGTDTLTVDANGVTIGGTSAEDDDIEEHFISIKETKAGNEKENPWYYFPVHIEDDIITVKITNDDVANKKNLYFVYDTDEEEPTPSSEDGTNKNKLAFVITLTSDDRPENIAENYMQFSFKALAGIKCRFDTFDDMYLKCVNANATNAEPGTDDYFVQQNSAELDPLPIEANHVFWLARTDHKHTNGSIANVNEKISAWASKFDESKTDILFRGVDNAFPGDATIAPYMFINGDFFNGQRNAYNDNWIKNIGISYMFKNDIALATQEDDLILVTNDF